MNDFDLLDTQGIGEYKAEKFGQPFLQVIRGFVKEKQLLGVRISTPARPLKQRRTNGRTEPAPKAETALVTFSLYQQGLDVTEIAEQRGLAPSTIAGHLTQLYVKGYAIDLTRIAGKDEMMEVKSYYINHPNALGEESITPTYNAFDQRIGFATIRLVKTLLQSGKL